MARMAKMASCPTCGAILAANQVKILKTDPETYTCPGGSSDSRKKWESDWGNDVQEQMVSVTEQSIDLNKENN